MGVNDVLNSLDQLGLKRPCSSTIRAGHTPDFAPYQFDKPGPCDRQTGVGCFSGDMNELLQGSVSWDNEKFDDPNIPNYFPPATKGGPPIPNPAEPGFLWPDEAYGNLKEAIDAAIAAAESDCKDEKKCCSRVNLKVECPPGGRRPGGGYEMDFHHIMKGRPNHENLCRLNKTLDCESMVWNTNFS